AVLAVFVTLSATFIVLCIGDFAQSPDTTKAGGWLGLVTAACAWYASFAGVTNSTYQRAVVPVFPNIGERLMPHRTHRGGPFAGAHTCVSRPARHSPTCCWMSCGSWRPPCWPPWPTPHRR